MKKKHRCCCCSNTAVWYNEYGDKRNGLYYCDSCIKRGSVTNVDNIEDFGEPTREVNIMWWDSKSVVKDLLKNGSLERTENSFYYELLDEHGRRNPSSEFTYDKDGFTIDNDVKSYVNWFDISNMINEYSYYLTNNEYSIIKDEICDIFLENRDKFDRTKIEYNVLMGKLGQYLLKYNESLMFIPMRKEEIRKFYINIKKQISEKKE